MDGLIGFIDRMGRYGVLIGCIDRVCYHPRYCWQDPQWFYAQPHNPIPPSHHSPCPDESLYSNPFFSYYSCCFVVVIAMAGKRYHQSGYCR